MKTEVQKLIIELSHLKNKTDEQKLYLNSLVLELSEAILKQYGKIFTVESGKFKSLKAGECYGNSANKLNSGFGYVEGYIKNKATGYKIGHAWNIDKNGNHIDFTIKNSNDFEYYGILINNKDVYRIGAENGFIWFATLPFLKIKVFN